MPGGTDYKDDVKISTQRSSVVDQLMRMRRSVVFRPSGPEDLPVGEEGSIDLDVHLVTGDGTTVTVDGSSTVSLGIEEGEGTIDTSQPVTFVQGVAQIRVTKTAPGEITVDIAGFTPAGAQEPFVTIDTTATKSLPDP